jgi:branched-chain amino acid transport system substrate-binding protein
MKKYFVFLITILLLISLNIVGFGSSEVIKIGLSAPITGNYAEFGENFRYATQMAADKINAAGGVRGYKIEIVVMDSKGDPRESALIAQKFVDDKSIIAEIGDFTSTCCLSAAPIYEAAKMVQLSPTASHPDFAPSGRFMFGIVGTQDAEGPFNVKYIAQDYLKLDSVAVIYINNDWGIVTKDRFVKAAEKYGLKVTAEEPFFEGERDFAAPLTNIRRTKPGGIYIAVMYNEAAIMAHQIQKLGWDVQLLAPSSVFSASLLELGGDAVERLATNTFFALNSPDPVVQEFIQEFNKRAGRDPNLHAACAYDTMGMMAQAIEEAGFDRAAIRDALAETKDYTGVTGKLTFTEAGDIVRKYMIMVVENGEWVIKADYTK